jgi:Fe-S cluster assembly scaffold protein SufB
MQKTVVKDRAKSAEKKTSVFGPDIDVDAFEVKTDKHEKVKKLTNIPDDIQEKSILVGIETEEKCRSGSFFQIDHSVIFSSSYQKGLEVMSITEAMERYDWLSEYWWKAVEVDADKYTAQAELIRHHGYFLRALPGVRVDFPLQACLFMTHDGLDQNVHNIIIAEEGSELNIITGCAVGKTLRNGLHIGISEFYVKKNAKITFTMIHDWAEGVAVRPRSTAIIEEKGLFLSNYICMKPVRTLQMYPAAHCIGEEATVRYNTVLLSRPGSHMDVGARVFLKAPGSRAEVVTRAITEGGDIVARGHLVGEVPGIKAHLECRGLILSDRGKIHAVPELEGRTKDVDMTHEAAVGKIAEEEIQYLMARGLSADEATAAIVRGFLDISIKGLPEHLEKEIKRAVRIEREKEKSGL